MDTMNGILLARRIRLWECVTQQYVLPKHQCAQLDKIIRSGEELPPAKKVRKGKPV